MTLEDLFNELKSPNSRLKILSGKNVWAKGKNADMGVKKSVLVGIIILLLFFLFCIPISLEWSIFEKLLCTYSKGFLIVVTARKTADWIVGDK